MKENKLVVLGAGGVGKTSLVLQFLQGFFSSTYKPTVEDCYSHTIQLPSGLFHSLEILDTAGYHHFPAMRELSIRSGRAFVIVFAVNNQQSFYEAMTFWDLIAKVKGYDNVPCVVVGNKVDLTAEREVMWEEANTWVGGAMRNAAYVDTSAKFNLNVTRVFEELLVLTFGIDERKERRPSRIRLSLSELSLIGRRKSSGALSSTASSLGMSCHGSSGLSDDFSPITFPDDDDDDHMGDVTTLGGWPRRLSNHDKCIIL